LSRAISSARAPDATRASRQLASAPALGSAFALAGAGAIAGRPLRANTTFGISFIGGANTSVEYGQYDAQPANERLPMM
jgi:hypothetical protein